jgi:hypothetical protein
MGQCRPDAEIRLTPERPNFQPRISDFADDKLIRVIRG